jgi:RNAse (barnase) inhibitor barstar
MNQKLKVEIGADVSGLQKGLNKAERELNNFDNTTRKASASFGKVTRGTKHATKEIGNLGKTTRVNAVPAMTSLSQVIQDAPYGIRGVANNIQQLTSQLGYLSASAGGGKGAFKALAGSLIGPAGILMAVSIVTSALVTYGDKLFATKDATNELDKATNDLIGTANSEISVLQSLLKVAQDESQSKESRSRAIKKINDLYGQYLPNLNLETVNTEKVKTAVDNLTNSLIRQAKIRGIQDVISKKAGEIAQKTAEVIKEAREDLQGMKGFSSGQDPRTLPKNLDEIKDKTKEVRQSLAKGIIDSKVFEETKDLQNELTQILGQLDQLVAEDLEAGGVFSSVKGKNKEEKAKENPHDPFLLAMEDRTAASKAFLDGFLDDEAKLRDALGAADWESKLNMADAVFGEEDEFDARLEEWKQKLADAAAHSQMIGQLIASGIGGAINQIANDFQEGELSLKSFVKTLQGMVIKIVAASLAQAIGQAIAGASTAATATGPAAPIVLPGLIAGATGAVMAGFSSIPGFEKGGIVPGNSFTGDKVLARLNSGEMILNKAQQKSLGVMLNAPGDMGGTTGDKLEIVGHSVISGDNLRVVFERNERRRNRLS